MYRKRITLMVFINVALWAFLVGFLVASHALKPYADTPSPEPKPFILADVPSVPDIDVTYVDTPNLTCGSVDTALGCWDGGNDVRIVSGLTEGMAAWVLAHETAHVYGATECAADDYAYAVTANRTMYHHASAYAKSCGNYLSLDVLYPPLPLTNS